MPCGATRNAALVTPVITKSVPARAGSRTFAIGIEYITEHGHIPRRDAGGFAERVDYATAASKAAWTHVRGVTSLETAAIEMDAVAALSRRCPDPTYHLIIAYAKHERPTRAQVIADTERLLGALDMHDHQYVLAAHHDTDDFHAHVIANRVGPDGKANSLWHERIIRERLCAKIANERGWAVVHGRHNHDLMLVQHEFPESSARRCSDSAYRRHEEYAEPSWHDLTRPAILPIVDRAASWHELHEGLATFGLRVTRIARGGRIQGLAFVEAREAPGRGCAASRIAPRCALRALEARLGAYMSIEDYAHRPTADGRQMDDRGTALDRSGGRWADLVRDTILRAVDEASSWQALRDRLAMRGIVVKLVQRGDRVQGLAFAAGHEPQSPGCGASRIDARCRLAALEARYGRFPREDMGYEPTRHEARENPAAERQQPQGARSHTRGPSAPPAPSDPHWALERATRIVDHLEVRNAYRAYRERYFRERVEAVRAHRADSWECEREQRRIEAERRSSARQMLRAVVRATSRASLRAAGYWSIDALLAQRRRDDYHAARARWEAIKIALVAERSTTYEEKPMDYRTFLADQARRGEVAARRLVSAEHTQREAASATLTLDEVRAALRAASAREQAHAFEVRSERTRLSRVAPPPPLEKVLSGGRRAVEARVDAQEGFSATERQRLEELKQQQGSWNPLLRTGAILADRNLRDAQQRRHEVALQAALAEFERTEVPSAQRTLAEEERRYRQVVATSLALEDEMRTINASLQNIRTTRAKLEVLERAHCERVFGGPADANLSSLTHAVDVAYLDIPPAERRAHERSIAQSMEQGRSDFATAEMR